MIITTETMIDPKGVNQRSDDWLTRRLHSLTRFQILLEGLTVAQNNNIPVVVNVGNSGSDDLGKMMYEELERRGAIIVPDPPDCNGMMGGRFAALERALKIGHDTILRVEDGKLERFLTDPCIDSVANAITRISRGVVDAVTFHRGSLDWYPVQQRQLEQEASRAIAELTGLLEYDAYSGPLMANQAAWRAVLDYHGEYGNSWASTCVLPPLRLLVKGFKVGVMDLSGFRYPLTQLLAEDGEPSMEQKRIAQQSIVDKIGEYVRDQTAAGSWPPASDLVLLD